MTDYDLTKIRAFVFDVDGVLSPSTIPMSHEGEPLRMINIKDGYALQLAVKKGYRIAIITGGTTLAVERRFTNLGIKNIYQGAAHKLPVLQEWMMNQGLKAEEVVYMGDDIPDLKCMRHVGLSCAPYDAAWECRETARYVSRFNGGYGCARDILEQVMKAQGVWMSDDDSFGW